MPKGALSVDTEHLFPIIKKWLYSEKDIFLREVLSNACDAVTKHKRLVSLSEAAESETPYRITVRADQDERTITVTDNGIGMSADEVDRYINSIALSGALDFISKYESESDNGGGIIGHFGLGFYSMFMVAERVEMRTKSYTEAPAVYWECDGSGNYEMRESDRAERGTEIVMHVADDELSYLDAANLKRILEKYCAFLPVEIYLCGEKDELVNDIHPLWQRSPSEVKDEEYKEFYKKNFGDFRDPLLWVHINADYPLNFKGVLFFPAKKSGYEPVESEIKLFYNAVFVADNIKEACPEFLVNVKGVLDCPELPLNVSRSYLQNDLYVRKVASHIAKKVADRIVSLSGNEREQFEKIWPDIKPYIEYACMRDEKFNERVSGGVLFEKAGGGFCTLEEYLGGDTQEGTVYYATDPQAQSYYLEMYREKGVDVLLFDALIDTNYAQFLESKHEKLKFTRIDADFGAVGEQGDGNEALVALFRKASGKEELKVECVRLGEAGAPALVSVNEESRRMADVMKVYAAGNGEGFPVEENLSLNLENPLIRKLSEIGDQARAEKVAKHVYLSALLLSRPLKPEELKDFVALNSELLLTSIA